MIKPTKLREGVNMQTTHTLNLFAATLVGVQAMSALATQTLAQENSFDKLANLPFSEGRPTKETAQTLRTVYAQAQQTFTESAQRPLDGDLQAVLKIT